VQSIAFYSVERPPAPERRTLMLDWGFLTLMAWTTYGVTFALGVLAGWLLRGALRRR
jgi:hypothetical protein